MDSLQQLTKKIKGQLFLRIALGNIVLVTLFWAGLRVKALDPSVVAAIVAAIGLVIAAAIAIPTTNWIQQPLEALWKVILHLSPSEHGVNAPKVEDLKLGRELVVNLTAQIYQLADVASKSAATSQAESQSLSKNFIAMNLPLPFVVLDATETIQFANQAAADYLGQTIAEIVGKNVYLLMDMSFPNEDTFDSWLKASKTNSATSTQSWERVRLNVRENHPTRLFDLAAYYNKDNTQKMETMLVLFDHTKQYSQDDQAISFVALSVHELRTPLTLLRGYIEVFEEELAGKVDEDLAGFMEKMSAQTQQLTAFVNNILNVARIEEDQLQLRLQSEDWSSVLTGAVEGIGIRAKVRGIDLQCKIAPELPAVGVDRISIHEVLNNLIDNAIKYSGDSKIIKIDAHLNQEGLVETSIQDFGMGIGTSVLPNLFTKFYRDHRNRAQIGGTGLGLYLCKTIVAAHGGTVTVNSKEGEGSTFAFTLVPYANLTEELKQSENKEIVRGAHGWIKNHSLYRR
jgi:signal transduction histidine kinase